MATDIDQQVGAPRAWTFAGREWAVSGLTPWQIGQLTARLKEVVPHPVEEAKKLLRDGVLTAEERKTILDAARAEAEPRYLTEGGRTVQVGGWPPAFGSTAASEHFFYGVGISYFLWVVLAKHQPALTLAEAEATAAHFGVADLEALMERISIGGGGAADDEEADEDDPAGPGGLPEGMVDPKA